MKNYNKKKILKFNKICFTLMNKMKSQNNMLINFKKVKISMKIIKMSKYNNKLRNKNMKKWKKKIVKVLKIWSHQKIKSMNKILNSNKI